MIQYFEKLQIDFDFVSKISATFNVHEKDEVFCTSLNTLTNVDCMLITKLLVNHAAKHRITDIDKSKNLPSIENSGTKSSISYAYISEDNSFNDENSRIFDVFDFFEHSISHETNDEISKHSTFSETKNENLTHFFLKQIVFFSDDSATQSIKRGRERPRKHATEKNFIFVFTSDINFFSNIFINRHLISNKLPYIKSRKKETIKLIDSNAATRSAK